LIDNRKFGLRLAEVSAGPVLSLPAGQLDRFMAQWATTNEQVARRYLADATGQLFHTPRKTSNITSEQRLDPERVGYFCAVLELPERLHVPLRRVAEREAKAALLG
jgi:hypothetical protein